MDPSQLRSLAEEHARHHIDTATYRARRQALIDGITSGQTTIERHARLANASPHRNTRRRIPMRALALAGALVGVVVLSLALIYREPALPPSESTPALNAPRQIISAAHGLVEEFLTRRDYSSQALTGFQARWDALAPNEHRQARAATWFSNLESAISDEVRTQQALAEIGNNPDATARATSLIAFAEHIGVKLQSTTSASPANGAPVARSSRHQPSLDGAAWLAIQSPDQLTLQLFAVNQLAHFEQLVQRFRHIDMYVLEVPQAAPRYRVVHGSFDGVDQAQSAYDALPVELRDLSQGAIIKSMSALRDDLTNTTASSATPAHNVNDAREYTLQLFATANAENAQALVNAYPSLKLNLAKVNDSASPHRVIYGRYTSSDEARAAREKLPADLKARIAEQPLIKPLDGLELR